MFPENGIVYIKSSCNYARMLRNIFKLDYDAIGLFYTSNINDTIVKHILILDIYSDKTPHWTNTVDFEILFQSDVIVSLDIKSIEDSYRFKTLLLQNFCTRGDPKLLFDGFISNFTPKEYAVIILKHKTVYLDEYKEILIKHLDKIDLTERVYIYEKDSILKSLIQHMIDSKRIDVSTLRKHGILLQDFDSIIHVRKNGFKLSNFYKEPIESIGEIIKSLINGNTLNLKRLIESYNLISDKKLDVPDITKVALVHTKRDTTSVMYKDMIVPMENYNLDYLSLEQLVSLYEVVPESELKLNIKKIITLKRNEY